MNTIEEVEAAACVLEDYDMLEEAKELRLRASGKTHEVANVVSMR